jgi:Tfp pilus assembly protein PilV
MLKGFTKLLYNSNSQKGFSLTEVMIGGGILAGVALAGAKLFRDQKLAQKKVSDEQRLALYHQNLVKEMSVASNCNATLKPFFGSGITALSTVSGIYKCESGCVDNNLANGSTAKNLNRTAADVTSNTSTPLAAPNSYIDNTQTWMVEGMTIPQARTSSGPVTIRVAYRMNQRIAGNRVINKDIVVNTRFNSSGQFQECLNGAESSINNLQNDFCRSLNFDEIDSTGAGNGQLARWNPETQTCEVGVNKDCNTPGMVIDGVDETGTVRCRPIVNSGNVSTTLQQTGQTTCPAGQVPAMSFSGGKIQVICTAGSNCVSQTVNWTVGSNTCSATVAATTNGGSVTASDSTAPLTGSQNYTCSSGTFTPSGTGTCGNEVFANVGSASMVTFYSSVVFFGHPSYWGSSVGNEKIIIRQVGSQTLAYAVNFPNADATSAFGYWQVAGWSQRPEELLCDLTSGSCAIPGYFTISLSYDGVNLQVVTSRYGNYQICPVGTSPGPCQEIDPGGGGGGSGGDDGGGD